MRPNRPGAGGCPDTTSPGGGALQAAPVIVVFSITIGNIIIAEASLSFLGFGLPTTVPSWGGMLSREGRQFMEMAPRLAMWPGVARTVVVYSLNLFGDAVRDLLDPRLRGAGGGAGLGGGGMSSRAAEGRPPRPGEGRAVDLIPVAVTISMTKTSQTGDSQSPPRGRQPDAQTAPRSANQIASS